MAKVTCLDQTEDVVWFLAGSSSRQPSVATTFRYAASTEVHAHSPVPPFPHPVRLDGSGSPWASPVCSRTPRYRGACAGREPTWTLVGAVVTRQLPLIWCDFVSHALYEIMAAIFREIGSGIHTFASSALRSSTRNPPDLSQALLLPQRAADPSHGPAPGTWSNDLPSSRWILAGQTRTRPGKSGCRATADTQAQGHAHQGNPVGGRFLSWPAHFYEHAHFPLDGMERAATI